MAKLIEYRKLPLADLLIEVLWEALGASIAMVADCLRSCAKEWSMGHVSGLMTRESLIKCLKCS